MNNKPYWTSYMKTPKRGERERENLQKSDFRSMPVVVGKDVDWRVIAQKKKKRLFRREMMLIAYLQMEKQRDILDLGKK